jgi:uncharacterized membrane protein YphA (DoxX/SURF4 family)
MNICCIRLSFTTFALLLAIFLVILEVVLGVMLLLGFMQVYRMVAAVDDFVFLRF